MDTREEAAYRLRVAERHLDRAMRLIEDRDYDGCVREAQVAVENAAKSSHSMLQDPKLDT